MFFSLPRSLIEGYTISWVLLVALGIARCPSRGRVFGARPSCLYYMDAAEGIPALIVKERQDGVIIKAAAR
jgi:hypothetical protein